MNCRTIVSFVVIVVSLRFLSGCAIAIPVSETQSPHTLGKKGLRVQMAESFEPQVGPRTIDEADAPGYPAQTAAQVGFNIGFGIRENIDLQMATASGTGGGSSSYGVKYQFLGQSLRESKARGPVASTYFRYYRSEGGGEADAKSADSTITIDFDEMTATGFQVGSSFGYQLGQSISLYGGVKYTTVDFKGDYQEGSSGTLQTDSRNFGGLGYYIGLSIHLIGERWGFVLDVESGLHNWPGSFTDKAATYPTGSVALGVVRNF